LLELLKGQRYKTAIELLDRFHERCGKAIAIVERQADGIATNAEIAEAERDMNDAYFEADDQAPSDRNNWPFICLWVPIAHVLNLLGHLLGYPDSSRPLAAKSVGLAEFLDDNCASEHLEREELCRLMRCLMGNPFRPVVQEPDLHAWNTDTTTNLA